MFNKTYSSTAPSLIFLKSSSVKAFPNGRRRSKEIDQDGSPDTSAKYYIPFDPEARLNTESNARKHSSLNGYTQTYLKEWDNGSDIPELIKNGRILLSLAGYLFDIDLDSCKTPATFGSEIAEQLGNTATKIYANIILEDVHLYSSASGLPEYYTSVLRDQIGAENESADNSPCSCLDLLNDDSQNHDYIANFENYYFSGLSFSVAPLTGEDGRASLLPKTVKRGGTAENPKYVNQQIVSLHLLEKVDDTWQIYQPALLPKIEHGTTDDSIVVYGNTTIKSSEERPTKLLVEGTAEIDGNTTIHSNLKVDDNINVGSLTEDEKAVANNGGCIIAKEDIIAKHDLKAENDLSVTKNATVKISLVVGERDESDSATSGDLTVKNHIKTPTVEATTSVTTPQANIETVLNVTNDNKNAQANIDNVTITGELKVQNESSNAKITADTAEITGSFTAKGTITAKEELVADANNLEVRKADINTLTGKDATIYDIVGINTVSSANIYQADYKVPVIELNPNGDFYQLKISRIGKKQ